MIAFLYQRSAIDTTSSMQEVCTKADEVETHAIGSAWTAQVVRFMRACATGDTEAVRTLLAEEPALARERLTGETTGLHLAGPHPDVVRVLLAHGADPNARDGGDNATPLHFAAAHGDVESVRLLLDAGADVHGTGDL